ncbi:MAG: YciI family protein [Pseudomonadota bacterium]
MLYTIIAEDLPGSLEKRLAARPAHLERLRALQADGRLVLAGPNPIIDSTDAGPAGFSGSLIVAEFASLNEAIAWTAEDPYATAGVYARVNVKPFKKVFPE